ncbi:hypothetical protein ACIA74_38815 [Streptomyces sp. NPDC051658]|uniref:hypothetical protein n=1 Tax=Streptomyces sp. NPDC051658 TaxID=3365667 RepID=UPI00379F7386
MPQTATLSMSPLPKNGGSTTNESVATASGPSAGRTIALPSISPTYTSPSTSALNSTGSRLNRAPVP